MLCVCLCGYRDFKGIEGFKITKNDLLAIMSYVIISALFCLLFVCLLAECGYVFANQAFLIALSVDCIFMFSNFLGQYDLIDNN